MKFDTYILLAEVNSNIAIPFCYLFNFICCLFAFNALQVLSFYLHETDEYVNGTSKIIEVQLGQKKKKNLHQNLVFSTMENLER